ncbi:prolipoprotein diacylglyceryl transferase [Streptomyces sp. ACA25]|uniref:prolipoprotein diacylglyceryl transferase n=1 Tax=Streptomyces sp. ACA25 TaxID=3022596 RepID=UPI002307D713|nr:prolipoprotein diacylglyceryl transferase [Streptomyces sp. ACA25]MDB1088607.1 prolipoprotein diacylglyceryl transferase [Streptomyces sp. ACA25]
MEILASIPSPGTSEIHLGPLPLRGYAVCIIAGVFLAIWLGGRRWVARGGKPGTVADIAVWAVPFGLVGARVYHVATDYQLYFGEGRDWVDAFRIWDGGIGIWGAIAGGALGAWFACRRRGIPLPAFADAVAPGIAFAQAIGRWGNWFNQELYGRPTDLPWALEIDTALGIETFHPTFLYESLWCIGVGALVIWADRRFRLGHGRAFALYVAAYTVGRFWIEYLRIDEAHEVFGLRLNNWTAVAVFLAAVAYFVLSARSRPGREDVVEPGAGDEAPDTGGEQAADADDSGKGEAGAESSGKAGSGEPAGATAVDTVAAPAGTKAAADTEEAASGDGDGAAGTASGTGKDTGPATDTRKDAGDSSGGKDSRES